MRYYEIPKKYIYSVSYLGINSRLANLNKQLSEMKAMNIPLLQKMQQRILETKGTNKYKTSYEVIYADISEFLREYKLSIDEVYKSTRIYSKGIRGENRAIEHIEEFKSEWSYIQSANINVQGQNIENDCLIISKYGLYTIEIKNIGNYNETLSFDKFGRTTRLDRRGHMIGDVDILGQSSRHLAILKTYLKDNFNFDVPVEQIVLIASNIKIKNKSPITVLGINTLYPYISNNNIVLTDSQVDIIHKKILDNLNEEKAYAIKEYSSVLMENYKNIIRSIKQEYN